MVTAAAPPGHLEHRYTQLSGRHGHGYRSTGTSGTQIHTAVRTAWSRLPFHRDIWNTDTHSGQDGMVTAAAPPGHLEHRYTQGSGRHGHGYRSTGTSGTQTHRGQDGYRSTGTSGTETHRGQDGYRSTGTSGTQIHTGVRTAWSRLPLHRDIWNTDTHRGQDGMVTATAPPGHLEHRYTQGSGRHGHSYRSTGTSGTQIHTEVRTAWSRLPLHRDIWNTDTHSGQDGMVTATVPPGHLEHRYTQRSGRHGHGCRSTGTSGTQTHRGQDGYRSTGTSGTQTHRGQDGYRSTGTSGTQIHTAVRMAWSRLPLHRDIWNTDTHSCQDGMVTAAAPPGHLEHRYTQRSGRHGHDYRSTGTSGTQIHTAVRTAWSRLPLHRDIWNTDTHSGQDGMVTATVPPGHLEHRYTQRSGRHGHGYRSTGTSGTQIHTAVRTAWSRLPLHRDIWNTDTHSGQDGMVTATAPPGHLEHRYTQRSERHGHGYRSTGTSGTQIHTAVRTAWSRLPLHRDIWNTDTHRGQDGMVTATAPPGHLEHRYTQRSERHGHDQNCSCPRYWQRDRPSSARNVGL